jgi:hypothetical protein
MEEDAVSRAIGEVIMHLCLWAKIQEVCLGELEDVVAVRPLQGLDGDDQVEPEYGELKYPPKINVSITGFIAHRRKGCINAQ